MGGIPRKPGTGSVYNKLLGALDTDTYERIDGNTDGTDATDGYARLARRTGIFVFSVLFVVQILV